MRFEIEATDAGCEVRMSFFSVFPIMAAAIEYVCSSWRYYFLSRRQKQEYIHRLNLAVWRQETLRRVSPMHSSLPPQNRLKSRRQALKKRPGIGRARRWLH